jgi:DNA-binding CsgD family transcriptional regulator
VRVVASGDALLAPSVTRRLIAEFAARPHTDRPRPTALNALTPREIDVLRLVARGRSNQEIAADLVVAAQTVKTHIGRILAKLGLRDRAQAVVSPGAPGLLTAPAGPSWALQRLAWLPVFVAILAALVRLRRSRTGGDRHAGRAH